MIRAILLSAVLTFGATQASADNHVLGDRERDMLCTAAGAGVAVALNPVFGIGVYLVVCLALLADQAK